ncbi:MAG TPA: putative capsular polysaccharide synthesis family protein [Polyangiales bacterium]|nr:putative capsular polysaccharide synthesis family protein [Polyangiales bacterium]
MVADESPILVYQMGKVGSRTVFETLAALGLRRSLYHLHMLNGLDAVERALRARAAPTPSALEHLGHSRRVRQLFQARTPRHWNVVTLVRDPVARNLSSFFYNIHDYIPDFDPRAACDVHALQHCFLERFDHAAALTWFDDQFVDPLGLDVFDTRFDAEAGFEIRKTDRLSVLLMRAEDIDAHLARALAALLGFESVEVRSVNHARDKDYGRCYRECMQHVRLPDAYLDVMYDSRLAQHFYSARELREFRERWSGKTP